METFLIILLILSLPFLIKPIFRLWAMNKVNQLKNKSPENAKAIDEMHNLSESINQRMNLENMLTEGRIDEAKLLDMLKGVWERLKNAIRTAWTKLLNVISNLVQQIKDAVDGGIDKMLNAFELEPIIRFNDNIKL